jgi:hypothetical protein
MKIGPSYCKRSGTTAVVTTALPHLRISCDAIAGLQNDDGSWFGDVLTTAVAVRALFSFANSVGDKKAYRKHIKLGASFLESALENISSSIIESRDLYPGLDKRAIDFGNAIQTLWEVDIPLRSDFANRVRSAFLKLIEAVSHHAKALDSIEPISSLILCCNLPGFPAPPETLVNHLINKCLSETTPPKDVFIGLRTLSQLKNIFENQWKKNTSLRTDQWKNKPLDLGLRELLHRNTAAILEDDMADMKTLSFALLAFGTVRHADKNQQINLIEVLLPRVLERLSEFRALSLPTQSTEVAPIFELSLSVWALSLSPVARVAFFEAKDAELVRTAVRWYEKRKSEGVRYLEAFQFHLLVGFAISMTAVSMALIILGFPEYRLFAGVFFTLLLFVLSQLKGKSAVRPD